MSKFKNSRTELFIKELSRSASLEDKENDLTIRSKFNFSYFDSSQAVGQNFSDWTNVQLNELLNKIKDFTTKPLEYWRRELTSNGLSVLVTYGTFPTNKSSFTCPKHIPIQALWGRFRLGSKIRLIGFTVPVELHKNLHTETNEYFDKNTFYVVFLDRDHCFYRTEKK